MDNTVILITFLVISCLINVFLYYKLYIYLKKDEYNYVMSVEDIPKDSLMYVNLGGDKGGMLATKLLPGSLISLTIMKVYENIAKYVLNNIGVGRNNMYGLNVLGRLMLNERINDKYTYCEYIEKEITLNDRFTSLMKILSESDNLVTIVIKLIEYGQNVMMEGTSIKQKIEMMSTAFNELKHMNLTDLTVFPKFCTKLTVLTIINIFNTKKPKLIYFLKHLSDEILSAFDYSFSIGNQSFVDYRILFKEFLPFVLENVNENDVRLLIDICMNGTVDVKTLIDNTVFTTKTSVIDALVSSPMYVIDMFNTKILDKID